MMWLVIRLLSEGLRVYFTHFIYVSLTLAQYPSECKLANSTPLFRNNNRQLSVDYRPVSLLASFPKICERVAFIHLYDLLL